MSGMRTVSFFGPKEGGIEGGRTEADNGRVAAGGFGDGKKLEDEISSGADCGEEGTGALPVSRTGNWIRTVSRGLTLGAGGAGGGVTGGCGSSMRTVSFFGWSGSAITVGEIDQKSPACHYSMLQRKKM
jgi:hypothetical protein